MTYHFYENIMDSIEEISENEEHTILFIYTNTRARIYIHYTYIHTHAHMHMYANPLTDSTLDVSQSSI